MVIPIVTFLVDSFWSQFLILIILLNVELICWYKFWRWFLTSFLPERKKIRETIDFTKEVALELKQTGYAERIVEHFENTFEWATHPDGRLFKMIKAGGHTMVLFLGAEPFVMGGRVAGVIFCATTGFRNGLYSLVVGNCVHVLISMGMWGLTFYIWEQYRGPFILVVTILLLFMARGYFWKRLKREQSSQKSP